VATRKLNNTNARSYSRVSKIYIDGEWVDPVTPATLDVINPTTEEPFATISMGSAADVDNAVVAAKMAFESFSNATVQERIEMLSAILDEYGKRYDDIAAAISTDVATVLAIHVIIFGHACNIWSEGLAAVVCSHSELR